MKTINVRDLQQRIKETIEAAQKDRVVITRHGKPVALVTGVEGYDWEDLYWSTHASFWKMIEDRRKDKREMISFDEMCRRLGIPHPGGRRRALAHRRGRRRA